ncbi:10362_t:CDS:1, partial [Scutellospora calospora]
LRLQKERNQTCYKIQSEFSPNNPYTQAQTEPNSQPTILKEKDSFPSMEIVIEEENFLKRNCLAKKAKDNSSDLNQETNTSPSNSESLEPESELVTTDSHKNRKRKNKKEIQENNTIITE